MNQSAAQRIEQAYRRLADVDRPEAWVTLRPELEVHSEAEAVDARVSTGETLPLAGLVMAVKDNIDVLGLATSAGHPSFSHFPERSATAVERLVAAGAIVLGKTNLDQFATGLVGTRSPFGAVRNSRFPDRISGGSSSGSAVTVALGIVDFALGTDTAGSGRVPAALNGIVGFKSTLGIVPVDGVVPASRSYDAVTVFAPTVSLASTVTAIMAGPSEINPLSRTWPDTVRLAAPPRPRVAVPRARDLESLSPELRVLFERAAQSLNDRGVELAEIDLSPFLECATLLYGGALVAERFAAYGDFLLENPEGADPTVSAIVAAARGRSGPALVTDQARVAEYRLETARLLEGFDALLIPTAPEHPTLDEVAADPIGVNSRLGTYTNFMNLLDMAGVAVPAGEVGDGLFGVTIAVRAFHDQVALELAGLLTGEAPPVLPTGGLDLVVFGAHLSGQPLNHALVATGARLIGTVSTSDDYRMHALPGPVAKPGVVRVAEHTGVRLEGELWSVPPAPLARFVAELPRPMSVGRITLDDGRETLGFGCSWPDGPDISAFGGWRNYLANTTAAR